MKMEENEKKKKKIVKKAKKVRGIVMMTLLCVLMMSAATYAWFTLSNTAKIANLTMTVGEATGLQIAKDVGTGENHTAGTYGGVLTFGDSEDGRLYKITGKLLPATTEDGITFKKPVYNEDGLISKVEATQNNDILKNNSADDAEGYYYETTFYLKALGSNPVYVQLKEGTNLPENGIFDASKGSTGTYVLGANGKTKKSEYYGSQAIRISLTAGTNPDPIKTIIYEPNSNVSGTDGTSAEKVSGLTINRATSTSKQLDTGSWDGNQTETLKISNTDGTLVTMRIWIEGEDPDCVNEISLNEIVAQLVFETVTN